MEQRYVGNSGLQVSRIGLGTMTWGDDTDADDAASQLETFVAAGGTLIDTANVYGGGDAEAIIGTLVPDVISRESLVLSATTSGVGGGRSALLRALDGSLQRLGTDYVDLWLVDGFDAAVPFEETCQAMERALSTGRAAYVGLSGHDGWQLATMAGAMTRRGYSVTAASNEYCLLRRDIEADVVPAAQTHGVGILAWAPLGRGVLTGKYRHGTPADSRGASERYAAYVDTYRTAEAVPVVDAIATAADGLATSPLAVAIAWAREQPAIASVIVGARNNAQLLGSLAADEVALPAAISVALNDVSG